MEHVRGAVSKTLHQVGDAMMALPSALLADIGHIATAGPSVRGNDTGGRTDE